MGQGISRRQFLSGTLASASTVLCGLPRLAPREGSAAEPCDVAASPAFLDAFPENNVAPVLTSVRRLGQLTGEVDPEGLPLINHTAGIGVGGTDLGFPVDVDDRTYFFFGDVVGPSGIPPRHLKGDPLYDPREFADCIAYTTAQAPEPNGLPLQFILSTGGSFRALSVQGMEPLG